MSTFECVVLKTKIEQTIQQPVEQAIEQLGEICEQVKCKWWMACLNKVVCYLGIIVIVVLAWVPVVVFKWYVHVQCRLGEVIVDVMLEVLKRAECMVVSAVFKVAKRFYRLRKDTRDRARRIFVLMLENRSFDHMLGYSVIDGVDAETGASTTIDNLIGLDVANTYDRNGQTIRAAPTTPAEYRIDPSDGDPAHEFNDVLIQLCGSANDYEPAVGVYPDPDCSGFLKSYTDLDQFPGTPSRVMEVFSEAQLPVLNALAKEFAVCDRWFSSLPGPTWPNRYFAHGGSSGGMDYSPGIAEIGLLLADGFKLSGGHLFQKLGCVPWEIFEGDDFPQCLSLEGMTISAAFGRFSNFSEFAPRVLRAGFEAEYVFIEPNYGDVTNHYDCGDSQHPLDDITRGERLIKQVYEAIRNSPHWDESVLIITWDEHGGFYDHVRPPMAIAPGDTATTLSQHGFNFERLGVRVPAIVVSPWIKKRTIDHRTYDHSSIPATVLRSKGMLPLTDRDAAARDVLDLLSLDTPRTDCPKQLPQPAESGYICEGDLTGNGVYEIPRDPGDEYHKKYEHFDRLPASTRMGVAVAARRHAGLIRPDSREQQQLLDRISQIRSVAEARAYVEAVRCLANARKPEKFGRRTRLVREKDAGAQKK